MNNQMFYKRLICPLVIALLISAAFSNVAFADDGTTSQITPIPTPFIDRQGGPVIHREPILRTSGSVNAPLDIYRAGWTDAWRTTLWEDGMLYVHHQGSHNSQSDLVEEQIWVDGSLNVDGYSVASCPNHSSGQFVSCVTDYRLHISYPETATSWHFFHKSGYTDQNFQTQKSI